MPAKKISRSEFKKQALRDTRQGTELETAKENAKKFSGGGWTVPKSGKYAAVTAEDGATFGKDKNGNLYVNLVFIINDPEMDAVGVQANTFHSLAEKGKRTIDMAYGMLFRQLEGLGYEITSSREEALDDILDAIDGINENRPEVTLSIEDRGQYGFQIVNIDLVNGEDTGDNDEDDDDEYEDEDDDDYDLEDEDDDEYEDDDEMPAVGDEVMFSPKKNARKAPCNVTAINRAKGTVTLVRAKDDRQFESVPITKLV